MYRSSYRRKWYNSRAGEVIAYLHTEENDPIERKNWCY